MKYCRDCGTKLLNTRKHLCPYCRKEIQHAKSLRQAHRNTLRDIRWRQMSSAEQQKILFERAKQILNEG